MMHESRFPSISKINTIILYSSGKERVGRAECEDSMDVFYCFYTAVEEESCGTNGHQCAYTCGLC